MLDEKGIAHTYREYTQDPLSRDELDAVVAALGVAPATLLRKNDAAYKELDWTGVESDGEILDRMAAHPTLLQRPIGWLGDRAVVGRPIENLLDLG